MHRPSTISTAWWRLPSGWDRQSAQSGVAEIEFSTTHTLNSAGRPTVRPGAFTLGAAGEKALTTRAACRLLPGARPELGQVAEGGRGVVVSLATWPAVPVRSLCSAVRTRAMIAVWSLLGQDG